MTDEQAAEFLQWMAEANGMLFGRRLPGGRYAGLMPFMTTTAIIVGKLGDDCGHDDRWCYRDTWQAILALETWDGTGEPEGWHRHPYSGRRISETGEEVDGDGNTVGAVGVMYQRW